MAGQKEPTPLQRAMLDTLEQQEACVEHTANLCGLTYRPEHERGAPETAPLILVQAMGRLEWRRDDGMTLR